MSDRTDSAASQFETGHQADSASDRPTPDHTTTIDQTTTIHRTSAAELRTTSLQPDPAVTATTAILPAVTTSTPRAAAPGDDPGTLVIEDGVVPRRLRRPLDLARFLTALVAIAAVGLLAYFATSTSAGIDQDITSSARLLPDPLRWAINVIGGVGLLGLPFAVAIDMLVRRRGRQLLDAVAALVIALIVLFIADILLTSYGSPRLVVALAGSTSESLSSTTSPVLGALVAFVTVARLISRSRWNVLAAAVVGSLVVLSIVGGGISVAGLGLSLLAGWALGLIVRYALGTPTTRPSGVAVAAALDRGGFPISVLRATETTDVGRRYIATTRRGDTLEVTVLDRDLEGAGLASTAWRAARLRADAGTGVFNMRRTLEHSALLAYAAQVASAPTPRLVLATEVGPDSALLAYERLDGRRFSELADTLTDTDLEAAWRALRTLQGHRIAHRGLVAEHLLRDSDGRVWVLGIDTGTIAVGDVVERIDIAELLCTLALLTDAERAIATGRRVLGREALTRALPVLQPVALSAPTRKAMRRNKDLIVALRDGLVEMQPDRQVEQIKLERVKPRTLLMIGVGTVAAYLLLTQLGQVDLVTLIGEASWQWVAVGAVFAVVTYIGAALSLSGFVPEKLSLIRTALAQLAADFATLVSPPTLGAVAINLRFLQKAGLHPALAAASVGVSQVAALIAHTLLLLAFGIAAGTQTDFSFDLPPWLLIAGIAIVILLAGLLALPPVRRVILDRVRPTLSQVVPRMVTIAQRPMKILEGFAGIVILNGAYIVVLVACVRAFGGTTGFAATAVVYLAGSVIGSAAPTPGGLGAVEAAMSAGLIAAGLDSGLAVSSVLLFRLLTFWIPTVPGWFSFNWLTKNSYL